MFSPFVCFALFVLLVVVSVVPGLAFVSGQMKVQVVVVRQACFF